MAGSEQHGSHLDAALAAALSSIPPAIVLFDADRRPVWCNRSMERLLDLDRGAADDLTALFGPLVTAGGALDESLVAAHAGTPSRIDPITLQTRRGPVEREGWIGPVDVGGEAVMAVLVLPADEERLHPLLANTHDIISVLAADGTIRYSNPAAGRLMSYEGEVLAGTSALDLVHPDDQEIVARAMADVGSFDGEALRLRLRFGDGWHHCLVHLADRLDDPAVNGVVVTVHDITELQQAEEMSTRLVAAAPDAMVVVDDDGTIVLANERAEALFGWSADELVGRSVDSLVPESLRERHRQHRAGYASDRRGRMMGEGIELVALRRDGTEVPVEVSLSTHDTHRGRLTSAAIRDITVQRETRRALEAALRGEQEVVSRLQEADALKAEFVSTVAHELKGPLSAISGFARLIERLLQVEDLSSSQVPDMATRISANADRLLEMIEQLLRFSRLEAGQAKIRPEEVGVEDVVRRSLELLGDALSGHDVVVSVPAGMRLWGDADGIANVLRNLLTNAAKFGPPGTTVWVEAQGSDGGVTVAVSDEGPGVEPDERQLVFDQFHQTADGKERGGSGIGLSIARRYVELHGGEIGVDQRPGAGARFWFTLPAAPSPAS